MTTDNTNQLPVPVARALANYASEPPAIISSLCRLLMAGNLAGTGRVCILPVDQGNEHGPTRSFKPNPPAFDPFYLYRLAVAAGFSAYAAPLGSLRIGAVEFPHVLKIAKLNASCPVRPGGDAAAVSGTVSQALAVEEAARLGCIGVGYTVYFGS